MSSNNQRNLKYFRPLVTVLDVIGYLEHTIGLQEKGKVTIDREQREDQTYLYFRVVWPDGLYWETSISWTEIMAMDDEAETMYMATLSNKAKHYRADHKPDPASKL